MNKEILKKELTKMGVKIIKGNYVRKSQIKKILTARTKVDCTFDEIIASANRTYTPDKYYVDFQKLPKCVQDQFDDVEPEMDASSYTVGEPTIFLRLTVETKDGAVIDFEVHVGKLEHDDVYDPETGDEDEDRWKYIADEMVATFDWRMQDVELEIVKEPKEIAKDKLSIKTSSGESVEISREDLKNVGNTNGRDIKCVKCKEPWENYYVVEDFTDEELENFAILSPQSDDPHGKPTRVSRLSGCPACQ